MRGRLTQLVVVAAGLWIPLCFATTPVAPAATTSVINGQEAAPGSFPYLAYVEFDNGVEGAACTGSVVSSNVVLTAAHCVLNHDFSAIEDPADFTVTTGNVNRLAPTRTVSLVTQIAVAPNLAYLVPSYVPFRGDAAVLRLAQPISSPAVRLATARVWNPGTAVGLAGWGLTKASNEYLPAYLRVGEAAVQNTGYCASNFSHFEAESLICTQDYPEAYFATCHGDSGGPLLMIAPGTTNEPLQIGVTSFGEGECSTELPDYFTNLVSIEPWVATKIAEYGGDPAPIPPAPVIAAPNPRPVAPTPPAVAPALPTLNASSARTFARRALSEGLGYRFDQHRALRLACTPLESAKQRCAVSWETATYRYSGTVTVNYLFEGATVVWADRYRVVRFPTRCHRSCRPTVFQGP